MPIYAYRCEACEASVEVMQKSTDPAPAACEACGKGPMAKQLSLSAFALKGTGWYVTDFKGGTANKAASAPAKTESSTKSGEAT
jgi:putative FmdB family regulatory protein